VLVAERLGQADVVASNDFILRKIVMVAPIWFSR